MRREPAVQLAGRAARLAAGAALAALAAPAAAVTLSVSPDKATYDLGETVTLTVIGDPIGTSDSGIFGRLEFWPWRTTPLDATQTQHTGGGGTMPWGVGPLRQSVAASEVFNQITTEDTLPAEQLQVATVTLCAELPGIVDVSWTLHDPYDPFGLSFFGLTSAPGTSFTIADLPGEPEASCLPEPSGAAALLAGVGALHGLARRRRTR